MNEPNNEQQEGVIIEPYRGPASDYTPPNIHPSSSHKQLTTTPTVTTASYQKMASWANRNKVHLMVVGLILFVSPFSPPLGLTAMLLLIGSLAGPAAADENVGQSDRHDQVNKWLRQAMVSTIFAVLLMLSSVFLIYLYLILWPLGLFALLILGSLLLISAISAIRSLLNHNRARHPLDVVLASLLILAFDAALTYYAAVLVKSLFDNPPMM